MSKILICTGIYPPAIGGPAQYAKEIEDEFRRQGHTVRVLTYTFERYLPTFIRHGFFLWKTLSVILKMRMRGRRSGDFIIALDAFSVGLPAAVAAKILGKKIVIRTGGDFLWESYVERTGDLVPLNIFYKKSKDNFNWKEKVIYEVTRWTLSNVGAVIFSTDWQRKIFETAYDLDSERNFVVENFYGQKLPRLEKTNRAFVAGSRSIKLKNFGRLEEAFVAAQKIDPSISFNFSNLPYEEFLKEIRTSYAVILVSISDISPNMILDAIRSDTPFILTKNTGLYEKLKDIAVFVDPESVEDIKEKILFLANKDNYDFQKQKVEAFNFTHSWVEICKEILLIAKTK